MPTRTKPSDAARAKARSDEKVVHAKKAASVGKKAPEANPSRKRPAAKGPKTAATDAPLSAFFASLDAATRADCERIDGWMQAATGTAGVMYGRAIVGYGISTIRYADGREAPWLKIGFAPRRQALTLYGVLSGTSPALLEKLGKHETGKGCLYVKRLAAIDTDALQSIIRAAARA